MRDYRSAETLAPTWVVGAGGLLGAALVRQLRRRRVPVITSAQVPWTDSRGVVPRLREQAYGLSREEGRPFRVAWCAGAGVTGTSAEALAQEGMVFAAFLAEIQALGPGVCDALFYASSAGGLYAGATEPPFTEEHPVIPISPYGHAKQAAELAVRQFADSTGTPSLIGRIANLYGAGQNLSKQQGLISHLCRAQIAAQPASIFVSLDTLRDYLFVDDCAEMVADALDDLRCVVTDRGGMGHSVVKIFASQQATTVGALIGECRRVLKRPLRVVRGTSPAAGYQTRDLRLRSTVWSSLDRRALTPLPVGIHSTYDGLLRLRQAPPLPVSLASRRYPQGGVSAP